MELGGGNERFVSIVRQGGEWRMKRGLWSMGLPVHVLCVRIFR